MACSTSTRMETQKPSSTIGTSMSNAGTSNAGTSMISAANAPTDYKLYDKWTLWAHLPHDTNWTFESYIRILTFDSAEAMIMLLETIPEEMTTNCMLFIMREGIKPMWEDPKNKKGGCFSYKINNKNVSSVWKNLSYSLVGESLTEDVNVRPCINGITISPKKNFCIVKIWLANCNYQNPAVIADNLGISSQGCLFKTHLS
jgi:translation initiation factor 4E